MLGDGWPNKIQGITETFGRNFNNTSNVTRSTHPNCVHGGAIMRIGAAGAVVEATICLRAFTASLNLSRSNTSVCIRSDGHAIKAHMYITSSKAFKLLILGPHRNIRSLSLPLHQPSPFETPFHRDSHKHPKSSTHSFDLREYLRNLTRSNCKHGVLTNQGRISSISEGPFQKEEPVKRKAWR